MPYRPLSDVNCTYGAPLGRSGTILDPDEPGPYYLRRVPLDSQGYDRGGAYWGLGAPIWHLQSQDGGFESFFRASSRASAKEKVRDEIPEARFFR